MDRARYIETLLRGAEAVGIEVDEARAGRLADHQVLVDKWAKRINLTTVTEADAAAIKHGLDCLLFTAFVPDEDLRPTVDVGSGGGFPGLILAIVQPERPMVLLEPIRKRASFLRTAAAQLALPHVRVIEGRLEATGDPGGLWPAERIVSRATIPPPQLVPLAARCLAPGGVLVLTAGAQALEVDALAELAESAGLRHEARRHFELPGGQTRVLDLVIKPDAHMVS